MLKHLPASEGRIAEISECQEADEVCQQIVEFCQSGWPEKSALPAEVKPCLCRIDSTERPLATWWPYRHSISTEEEAAGQDSQWPSGYH